MLTLKLDKTFFYYECIKTLWRLYKNNSVRKKITQKKIIIFNFPNSLSILCPISQSLSLEFYYSQYFLQFLQTLMFVMKYLKKQSQRAYKLDFCLTWDFQALIRGTSM